MVILLLAILVGCQSYNTGSKDNSGLKEDAQGHIEPPEYIGVRSLAQLEEMNRMLQCSDEELVSYLKSVEGGGADSREDIENFISLIASIPNLELIDGDIEWIAHYADPNVVYISTKGLNGDWTRIEYLLAANDVYGELKKLRDEGKLDKSTISDIIQCQDGRLKIFSEIKEAHPSGAGNTVEWMLTIDNTLACVVYYTADSGDARASDVFDSAALTKLR